MVLDIARASATVALAVSLFVVTSLAQIKSDERALVASAGQLSKYSSYGNDYSEENDERLARANEAFRILVLSITRQNPESLEYDFPSLQEHVRIRSSPDGNFRIYSWDTESGGTMHFFENVIQFRTPSGVRSRPGFYGEGDAQSMIDRLEQFPSANGMVYLAFASSILSTSLRGQSVTAYRINKNRSRVEEAPIFVSPEGRTASLAIGFDFFSVPEDARGENLIRFDAAAGTIGLPVVVEDEEYRQGRITGKYEEYRFDGRRFRKRPRSN